MNLLPGFHRLRNFLMLAPRTANLSSFGQVSGDPLLYHRVLSAVQRFRGQVYLSENNLKPSDLTPDGRHMQASDYESWHLITLTSEGKVGSCGRLRIYQESSCFSDLAVSHSALAKSPVWGASVRKAVEQILATTRRKRLKFSELGGWAIAPELRCTTEAVSMLLAGYALADTIGGIAGISTVNLRHGSASILRRMGGVPLESDGQELPSYYEPQYSSELEILRFDSKSANPRFRTRIQECRALLRHMPVICPERTADLRMGPLANLQGWLNGTIGLPSAEVPFAPQLLSS